MPALRTLLASLLILAAGSATLAAATDGFRAFTSEAARRLAVAEQPRPVPAVVLQGSGGEALPLAALRGRWLLVNFFYTRCPTYCSIQGSEFARLQDELADAIAARKAALLSISFDPAHDEPRELAAYLERSRSRGEGWFAARPTDAADLRALKQAFGVTVIADGLGGFEHNAAILVVDPAGRLVSVIDWDAPEDALRVLRQGLEAAMSLQMLVQIPLLALAGWWLLPLLPRRALDAIADWNRSGISGLLLATLVAMVWMLPRSMDAAIESFAVEVLKFTSVPLLIGMALAASWPRAGFVVRGVFLVEAIATAFRVGWLYEAAPQRLCTNYLLGDQQLLGRLLFALGAVTSLWLVGRLVWGRTDVGERMLR